MKKLIIIGNGFDLAHGLPTSYKQFLESLFTNRNHGLIKIDDFPFSRNGQKVPMHYSDFERNPELLNNRAITIENNFLKSLLRDLTLNKWVDIEQKYFEILLTRKDSMIEQFHQEFNQVKNLLLEYLRTLDFDVTKDNFYHLFNEGDPKEIKFLNFNYTPVVDSYVEFYSNESINCSSINIHGNILDNSNQIIFGYGDEETNEYSELVQRNKNEYLKNIKSHYYNNGYRELIDYLNEPTEIEIIGHSCGLSDRTLLSEVFTNKNATSIKIHYYDTFEHFTDIRMNIDRICLPNRVKVKIIPFEQTNALPQIKN